MTSIDKVLNSLKEFTESKLNTAEFDDLRRSVSQRLRGIENEVRIKGDRLNQKLQRLTFLEPNLNEIKLKLAEIWQLLEDIEASCSRLNEINEKERVSKNRKKNAINKDQTSTKKESVE